LDQRIAQARGAEAAIASDIDVGATARICAASGGPPKISAEASSKLFDIRAEELDVGNAPDVILSENGRLEHTL
jgi:hypothetical protein